MAKKRFNALNGTAIEPNSPLQSVTPEDRERMVAEAAYYRALQRGRSGGDPVDDWLHAEQEINNALLNPLSRNSPRVSSSQPTQHRNERESQQPRRGR
ncbi:MAG: DUF2934 domain-containing protein [Burkholderiales bacterium]